VRYSRTPSPLIAAIAAAALAGCSASGAAAPTATPAPDAAASPEALIGVADCVDASGQPGHGPPFSGWPVPGNAQATGDLIPYIISSQAFGGTNRFLFTLIDSQNASLAAADVPVTARFYDLAADPASPVATVEASYLDPGANARGSYRALVDFRCAGDWGLEVVAGLPSGETTSKVMFTVLPYGTYPAVGARAIASDSLVATTPDELARISTDDDPDPDFYRSTIAQAVTSGTPAAIFFATPLFCRTATCGPMLDLVKSVAMDFKDRVTFVNVEPYQLQETGAGLQPVVDSDGHLQTMQAVRDWGLPSEPFLFLVDADGRIASSYEGLLDEDELREGLSAITGG
jgi:hypothetical protein